jgi:hypothetical protein
MPTPADIDAFVPPTFPTPAATVGSVVIFVDAAATPGSGDGSAARPFATLEQALDAAAAGAADAKTVVVRTGVYVPFSPRADASRCFADKCAALLTNALSQARMRSVGGGGVVVVVVEVVVVAVVVVVEEEEVVVVVVGAHDIVAQPTNARARARARALADAFSTTVITPPGSC